MEPTPTPQRFDICSRGMIAVLIAQFISAFADNALLFAAIALLRTQMAESWQIPYYSNSSLSLSSSSRLSSDLLPTAYPKAESCCWLMA